TLTLQARQWQPDHLGSGACERHISVNHMHIDELTIGLLGGTGDEGRGLALRWAKAGARVIIGSRSIEKAQSAADEVNRLLGGGKCVEAAENVKSASQADFVLLSVPFEHADAIVGAHQSYFRKGSILIDATVPLSFEGGKVRYVESPEGSASEHLRTILRPDIPLVTAFKTMPAHVLLDPAESLDCDDFVAGDSKDARARVIEAMSFIEGLRGVDAGTLESARAIERFTLLAVGINRRYKKKSARYRVVGI
ncbi:MAG: NADPH-dependent F420 reductase, partial [Blastocatellia bacterium]